MFSFLHRQKIIWSQKKIATSIVVSLLFLVLSFVVNNYANVYSLAHISSPVNDIILDNIPTVDVHLIFSEGAILLVLIIVALLVNEPKYIPFVVKSIALFIIVRSLFMILTHLGPPHNQIYINPHDFIQTVSAGGDMFFSAHTGLPFLMAIIFWPKRILRYFFLLATIIGGTAVLLGHLHYSIDVFSALFISFGIYHIAKFYFKEDLALLES